MYFISNFNRNNVLKNKMVIANKALRTFLCREGRTEVTWPLGTRLTRLDESGQYSSVPHSPLHSRSGSSLRTSTCCRILLFTRRQKKTALYSPMFVCHVSYQQVADKISELRYICIRRRRRWNFEKADMSPGEHQRNRSICEIISEATVVHRFHYTCQHGDYFRGLVNVRQHLLGLPWTLSSSSNGAPRGNLDDL